MQNSPTVPATPDLADLVRRIAFASPRLTDLSGPQLEHLAHSLVLANLQAELGRMADLAKVPYAKEREMFLAQAGRSASAATRRAYGLALGRLEAWCAIRGLTVLDLKPRDADEFLYAQRSGFRAPASVRLDAAGASSFFSFLERRHPVLSNPFRGSRARPAPVPVRRLAIPSRTEFEALVEAADPVLGAALVLLGSRGLRVGALPTLQLCGSRFRAWSKGRVVTGTLPPVALEALDRAGLDRRRPFVGQTSRALTHRILYHSRKLTRAGLVREAYSAHDLRHFFAVEHYEKTGDLWGLQRLLSHSSTAVTERYLRSIDAL